MKRDCQAISDRVSAWLAANLPLADADGCEGAVPTWFETDGSWDAAYPEIAGYFLSYLSWRADADSAPAARAVASWLDRISRTGPPATRIYPDSRPDWRNDYVFSFDLAMVSRGLLQARSLASATASALADRYVDFLGELAPDERLAPVAVRPHASGAIPDRWSTRSGPHHLKAAAAIAGHSSSTARRLSEATVAAWLPHLVEWTNSVAATDLGAHAHPVLYGVEGLLILWSQDQEADKLSLAAQTFLALTDRFRLTPAAALGRAGAPDVAAQALRAAAILEASGAINRESITDLRIQFLTCIEAACMPDGAVVFDRVNQHRNVWAALFTTQAAHFEAERRSGRLAPRVSAASII